jgi:hypothetical protein
VTAPVLHQQDAARDVRVYLERAGWAAATSGDAGELWRHADAEHAIAVPWQLAPGTPEWRAVAERLAAFERVRIRIVEERLRRVWVDVTRLRAANDVVIAGSIPLSAGAALVSSASVLVRAAATTAQKLKGDIGGNFSKRGDELAAEARLGHTEEGSYIVPVLVPLSPPKEQLPGQVTQDELRGLEAARNPYEPAERRVTRTLAEALGALRSSIVEPAKDVTASALHPFVHAGGSRELVLAVSRVLEQEAVAVFEASFEWAPALDAPPAPAEPVRVEAEANELLRKAARLLRQERYSPAQMLTGPIVGIRHEPDAPRGEVSIQTVYRGRACEVRIIVPANTVRLANGWMPEQTVILVEGRVRSLPGERLTVQEPQRVAPLDETLLRAE